MALDQDYLNQQDFTQSEDLDRDDEENVDIQKLAQAVFDRIKREIEIENERLGRIPRF
jgi:uncharacterized protein (DUF2267 family)